jgi:hypothetical protein
MCMRTTAAQWVSSTSRFERIAEAFFAKPEESV